MVSSLGCQGPIITAKCNSFYKSLSNHDCSDTIIKTTYSLFLHDDLEHLHQTKTSICIIYKRWSQYEISIEVGAHLLGKSAPSFLMSRMDRLQELPPLLPQNPQLTTKLSYPYSWKCMVVESEEDF